MGIGVGLDALRDRDALVLRGRSLVADGGRVPGGVCVGSLGVGGVDRDCKVLVDVERLGMSGLIVRGGGRSLRVCISSEEPRGAILPDGVPEERRVGVVGGVISRRGEPYPVFLGLACLTVFSSSSIVPPDLSTALAPIPALFTSSPSLPNITVTRCLSIPFPCPSPSSPASSSAYIAKAPVDIDPLDNDGGCHFPSSPLCIAGNTLGAIIPFLLVAPGNPDAVTRPSSGGTAGANVDFRDVVGRESYTKFRIFALVDEVEGSEEEEKGSGEVIRARANSPLRPLLGVEDEGRDEEVGLGMLWMLRRCGGGVWV
jgi:hypothetical protein